MRITAAVAILSSLPAVAAAQGPQNPPPPAGGGDGGPYMHQIGSASSPDGLTWTHDGVVLLEHCSVPAAIVLPDGRVRLYLVDSTERPENMNCAESTDGGRTFRMAGCTIANRGGAKALDPSVVRLADGRYRLYYYASSPDVNEAGEHAVHSAISHDGIAFEDEGPAFTYQGLVDPDVFWTGRDWVMFVFAGGAGGTIMAESRDGRSFSYVGRFPLPNWGTTAPVALGDGRLRLYAFDQPAARFVRSFLSTDGLTWEMEEGIRLAAPEGRQLTDPFVVKMPDGSWKMFYKTSARPTPGPPPAASSLGRPRPRSLH